MLAYKRYLQEILNTQCTYMLVVIWLKTFGKIFQSFCYVMMQFCEIDPKWQQIA